ncbi:hypothetical protein NE865_00063 [Phthorimaea operculella]|nr:hypothetical protein NE865_00063 [Phthorimaea operculella]
MKFFYLIALCAISSGFEISQVAVPLYADPRRAAELSCHFQMDEQRLHSVKWYRDMNEIFRYNPSLKPPIRLFNVSGIMVQGGACEQGSCTVRVMPPPVAARAAYSCEVSTEGPKFQIASLTKHMTVVAMPEKDPVIIGAPKLVQPGEQMLLNCTTDYSLPHSEINWYIDNELQKPELWQRTELSAPQEGVEPPVVRDAVATITVYSRTELSKYISSYGTSHIKRTSASCNLIAFIWTVIEILRFVSL